MHPFFGAKDYGRLAILCEFQLSYILLLWFTGVYGYDVVDETGGSMRKGGGGFCQKRGRVWTWTNGMQVAGSGVDRCDGRYMDGINGFIWK
jgi:hypothetical protein